MPVCLSSRLILLFLVSDCRNTIRYVNTRSKTCHRIYVILIIQELAVLNLFKFTWHKLTYDKCFVFASICQRRVKRVNFVRDLRIIVRHLCVIIFIVSSAWRKIRSVTPCSCACIFYNLVSGRNGISSSRTWRSAYRRFHLVKLSRGIATCSVDSLDAESERVDACCHFA